SNTWKVSVDGSSFAGATRGKVINAGDTIALRWGELSLPGARLPDAGRRRSSPDATA
nr:hypothetical protein [Streptomyces sp. SID7803]